MSPPRVGGVFPLIFSVTGYNPSLKTLNDGTFSPLLNPNQYAAYEKMRTVGNSCIKCKKNCILCMYFFIKQDYYISEKIILSEGYEQDENYSMR